MALTSARTLVVACFIFCLTFISHVSCGREDIRDTDTIAAEFDVKPGGEIHEHEETVDSFKCKFIYASQGGTKEQWLMKIRHSADKKDWSCSVERPSGTSYLFFMQFKMQVSGATIRNAAAVGQRSDLSPSEYKIDNSDNSVVQVDGKFQASLNRLEVYATAGKEEL